MFQDLDDPLPLPASSREQRHAVISRGYSLRRRRRARAIGVPLGAAGVAASAVLLLSFAPEPSGGDRLTPAALPPPVLDLDEAAQTTFPAYTACLDPVGDSTRKPDISLFSLDRPHVPFVHYSWQTGTLPSEGVVELRFEATSADGLRSRQLVQRTVAGEVVEQFLRDPRTGARRDVPHSPNHNLGDLTLGASFPGGALSGLGPGWNWVGYLSINGAVTDSCDPTLDGRGAR